MLGIGLKIGHSFKIEIGEHLLASVGLLSVNEYGDALLGMEQAGIEWFAVSLGRQNFLRLKIGNDQIKIIHAGRQGIDSQKIWIDAPKHISITRDNCICVPEIADMMCLTPDDGARRAS